MTPAETPSVAESVEQVRAREFLAIQAETASAGKYLARDIRAGNHSPDTERAIRAIAASYEAGRAEGVREAAEVAVRVSRAAANEVQNYDYYGGPPLSGREREKLKERVALEITTAIRALSKEPTK